MKYLLYNLIKITIASSALLFFTGCLNQDKPAPADPEPPKIHDPIPFPLDYTRSSATIKIIVNKTTAETTAKIFLDENVYSLVGIPKAYAAESAITYSVKNSYKSLIDLSLSQFLIPPKVYPQETSLGKIVFSKMKDDLLKSCAGEMCNQLFIRSYFTEQEKSGLINNSLESKPAATVSINNIIIPNSKSEAATIQEQLIPATKESISLSDLTIKPEFEIKADFSNLPSGTYHGNLVIEYGLKLNKTPESSSPSVNLLSFVSPDGIYKGGLTQQIKWAAVDDNFYYRPVKIEYSSDGGVSWELIKDNLVNNGLYNWAIPSINTEKAKIKITVVDLSGNIKSTVSENFTIDSISPLVDITSFTRSQKYPGGVSVDISWNASDLHMAENPIKIEYSPDGGVNWFSIANSTPNTGSMPWTLPHIDSTKVKVRVSAVDSAGNSSISESGFFTIDSTNPTLILSSLGGNETFAGGSLHQIIWESNDLNFGISPIKIEYSKNNGETWENISEETQNSGSYPWILPLIDNDSVKIKITATDEVGNVNVVESATAFEIDSTYPQIQVNAPSSSEFLTATTSKEIKWIGSDKNLIDKPVKLEFSSDSINWTTISASVSNSGNYNWTVPSVDSNQCKIKITIKDSVGHSSVSETEFFTISKGFPETIELISGNNQVVARRITTPLPLRSLVKDRHGKPARPNTPVSIKIKNGSGSLLSNTVYTNTEGFADFYYTAGQEIETATISAEVFKEDSSPISTNFYVTSKNYSPTLVSVSAAGSVEYVYFNKDALGVSPTGVSVSSINSTYTANQVGLSFISAPINPTSQVSSNQTSLIQLGQNMTRESDSVDFTITASYPSEVSSGYCKTISSIPALDNSSCAVNQSPPNFSIPRGSIDNGTVKFRILSNNFGPLDYSDSSSFSLYRNSIKIISNTNSNGDDQILTKPVVYNSKVYFSAYNNLGFNKLYSYNPSNNSLVQVSNLAGSETKHDQVSELIIYNNQLFFAAEKSTGIKKLFKYCDGSSGMNCGPETIKQISDIAGQTFSDGVSSLTIFNSTLYFKGTNSSGNSKLFKYCDNNFQCGTVGVYQITDLRSNASDDIGAMVSYESSLWFSARNPSGYFKLFKYCDGQACGNQSIVQFSNTAGTNLDDSPSNLYVFSGVLFFSAKNSSGQTKLFTYESLENSLKQISNINSSGSDNPKSYLSYGGELFFTATKSTNVYKLYKYNIQSKTITQVSDIRTVDSDEILDIAQYNNSLFLSMRNSLGVNKLFRYKGDKFEQVSNLSIGDNDDIHFITNVGNTIYFKAKINNEYSLFRYCEVSTGCAP